MRKEKQFSISVFFMFFAVLLLMSGIHMGIVIFMAEMDWNGIFQMAVPVIYWGIVAGGLVLITRRQIKAAYEEPVQKLAGAIRRVADGDFSVYVHPAHRADRLDYLDRMILDFDKMVEELGSIETLKNDFIANISHEMKTPIAIIKNYAELLREEYLSEEQRIKYAATIEETAVKLNHLIGNILKLNKLENQRIVRKTGSYDVCRQICDCVISFQEKWEEKNIELEIDMEDMAEIEADEQLMELVWNNLLSNAIKFTESGGKISVKQTSDEEQIRVTIADSGCGMSRECMKHIFDKFYQGDTSHSVEGNGLGLTLVYRVLQLMDGEIQVESQYGEGSIFTVVLPIKENSDEPYGN